MPGRYLIALSLAVPVAALDQVIKIWVQNTLTLWESIPVVPGLFNLVHVLNRGSAFGFLNDAGTTWQRWFFIAASLLAIGVIAYLLHTEARRNRMLTVGLGLLLGGAVGNLIDRVRLGFVVDFLDFHWHGHHWPAFNVADSAITVGVFALIASMYMSSRKNNSGNKTGKQYGADDAR